MTKEEKLAPGLVVERDEKGRFAKSTLTPERAREIGRKGGAVARISKDSQELADALKELIVGREEGPRADALSVLLERLAHIAAKDTGKGLQAITQAMSMIGGDEGSMQPPLAGERCALCGEVYRPEDAIEMTSDAEGLLRGVVS